jgi:glycosyltransferase involved in cell wall biosynthesis
MSDAVSVSAIVICFDAAHFLTDAIESVLAQRYADWELLVVDDGSQDGSRELALGYGHEYPEKIRYLEHENHENRGMSASRNLGIRNASGTYLAFLDADDVWLPTALGDQRAILECRPEIAMVYGPIQWWYSWTGDAQDLRRDFNQDLGIEPNTIVRSPELLVRFLRRDTAAPSGLMVRRRVAEAVGGFEEVFGGMYEDQAFCTKVCLREPVYVAGTCWYRYRQHPDSSGARARSTGQYEFGRLAFLRWLEEYLSDQGFAGSEVWDALQKELWLYRHPVVHHLFRRLKGNVRRVKGILQGSVPLRK